MAAGPNRPQENQENPAPRDNRREQGMGPLPLHGSGSAASMPNLAAAQIPGPGAGHVVAGETGAVPDDAADPFEKQGHEHAHHESGERPPWYRRLFRRH
ncbi:hypothetical protein ACFQ36_07700 [Arthrobacter sp. GCM10027362]|uniref:hypothetical protein n=1 Tax=Arthrobacter sp. GCM10027362 TaxID=3273379 RepID=UPI003639E1A5